jgi:hypothetical protein
MRAWLWLLVVLGAGGARAAPQVYNCAYLNNPTHPPQYIPVAASNAAFAKVSAVASGSPWTCKALSTVPATQYVNVTLDAGKTSSWVTLGSLSLGSGPVVLPTTATLAWVAPTVDVTGAPLTLPLTYNVYRGPSAAALVLLKNVSGLTTTDTVTVDGTYWYAVTANCAGCKESTQSAAVSALLAAGKVVSPAPPTSVSVTMHVTVVP